MDSYLTCLTSAPLQGVTCTTNGPLSSKKAPISLEVAIDHIEMEPFMISDLAATPGGDAWDSANCAGLLYFTLSSPTLEACSVEWPCSAVEPPANKSNHCATADYKWSAVPENNASIFFGFTLELSRQIEIMVGHRPLNIEIHAMKLLALEVDLEENREDCDKEGRCGLMLLTAAVVLDIQEVLLDG
jgi:hypothetical protein